VSPDPSLSEKSKLTELPVSIRHLTELKSLLLVNNQLKELPELLAQLKNLRTLDLSNNKMTVLPEWLGQLSQLQSLTLSGNRLAALSASVGQMRKLQSLNLSSTKLTALPKELAELQNLRSLYFSNNDSQSLPDILRQLQRLRILDIAGNRLAAAPDWLGELTLLERLALSNNKLTALPTSLCNLSSLKLLELFDNQLTELPECLGQLAELKSLNIGRNSWKTLPSVVGQLTCLQELVIYEYSMSVLPDWLRKLTQLQRLYLNRNKITQLPDWLGKLSKLETLQLANNKIVDLPPSIAQLEKLNELSIHSNPLNPELAAAFKEGLSAIKRYLRAKSGAQVELNEAKLILIGEGEVGKSSLLSALRGDPWVEGNPTTHGIEIKQIKVMDRESKTEITLNGWDFGGQRVYRPTHQLFFSAPAIYLVVWKPREGPQQGFVKEWITLVKHRAPDAKIIVVATHGGPTERQPDIDRQEIWDLFGKDLVLDFLLVDSKPREKTNDRRGIQELKQMIACAAASLPEMGREVPQRWEQTRHALEKTGAAYLPFSEVIRLCHGQMMDEEEAKDFVRISHRLGHLIHYEHDPALQDIVVLKPDWLSTAISFVLDDAQTRTAHGLVSFARLGHLWDDPKRPQDRYPSAIHSIFLRLMERYDLSYRIAEPQKRETGETSLIAQLVPDVRPTEAELKAVWLPDLGRGEVQQVQICRIVDAKTGQSGTAEGLFFQLIVRFHKYSLGRADYARSVHWQRGLVLEDDYGARALLEHVGNDVRISVRSPYPERFLAALTYDVKWLVENFWAGLRCDVMVPCIEPCGRKEPGTGLFEVERLIDSKRRDRLDYPCSVCNEWQDIEALLHNAPAARPNPLESLLANSAEILKILMDVRQEVGASNAEIRELESKIDAGYTELMRALTDEAKEGPRLFSFEPMDRRVFDRPKWISAKFRLTLWCEHSRRPLPVINGKDDTRGVYELDIPREWLVKATPYLKLVTGLLSLVVPVATAAIKLELDDKAVKGIEKQLEFGQKGLESALKIGESVEGWGSERGAPDPDHSSVIRAKAAVLRQLHAWLKEKDPGFGGLTRVQNKRREFLWVHPNFESEY